jgi:hypothetical protein
MSQAMLKPGDISVSAVAEKFHMARRRCIATSTSIRNVFYRMDDTP